MGLNLAINNPVFDKVIYSLTSLNGDFSTHRLLAGNVTFRIYVNSVHHYPLQKHLMSDSKINKMYIIISLR